MVASKKESEITRNLMVSQLFSVENERIRCRVNFNKRQEALVAEKKEISDYYDKVIQPQNKLLDRLDPQRIAKPVHGFLGKIYPFLRQLSQERVVIGRAA